MGCRRHRSRSPHRTALRRADLSGLRAVVRGPLHDGALLRAGGPPDGGASHHLIITPVPLSSPGKVGAYFVSLLFVNKYDIM